MWADQRATIVVALAWAAFSSAHGQVVRGRVEDLGTRAPIPHVNVSLWNGGDSTVRTTTTDDSGQFSFKTPKPGKYSVDLRHISYSRVTTTPVMVNVGDTIAVVLAMAYSGVLLDTVVSKESETRGVFQMTSGLEYVRQHYLIGKGLIVSGAMIEKSGMTMSEYLGSLKGLHLSGASGSFFSTSGGANSSGMQSGQMGDAVPVIPAGKGEFLLSDSGTQCLYARIDRFSLLYMLMQNHAESIDDVVKLKDVMAVELYRSHREVPTEWGQDAVATELYSRRNQGQAYTIGHTGFPGIDQAGSNSASTSGAMTPLALDSLDFGTFPLDPLSNRPPACGFVQIWTGAAWGDRGKSGGGLR